MTIIAKWVGLWSKLKCALIGTTHTWTSMEVEESSEGMEDGEIVVPGDVLGSDKAFSAGEGTCVRGGKIYSKLVGKVSISSEVKSKKSPVVSVNRHPVAPGLKNVPSIGSITLCRVINISERQAKVNILAIRGVVLPEPLHGVIRREDIRAMEKDTVEVFHSLRPRDIVRARVIAHGEGQLYVLSTAENELGVVSSRCDESGENMVPVSWCEMQCVKTGNREKRKVAKVVDAIPVLV